jgi:hypothetical protein
MIDLMPLLAGLTLGRRGQLESLRVCGRLGSDGFTAAVAAGDPFHGLQIIERARGNMWSQALQINEIYTHDIPSPLQDELSRLLELVSLASPDRNPTPSPDAGFPTDNDRRLQHWNRIRTIMDEVRAMPGNEDFMRGETFATLVKAASRHPVIVLVAGRKQCLALVLRTADDSLPQVLPLDIQREQLSQLSVESSGSGVRGSGPESADTRGMQIRRQASDGEKTLTWLWRHIVKPIIDVLGVQVRFSCLLVHRQIF